MPIVTPALRVQSAACRKCWCNKHMYVYIYIYCVYIYVNIDIYKCCVYIYIYINSNIFQIEYMYIICIYIYIYVSYIFQHDLFYKLHQPSSPPQRNAMPGTTSSPPSPRSRAAVRQLLPRQRPPRRLPESPTVGT